MTTKIFDRKDANSSPSTACFAILEAEMGDRVSGDGTDVEAVDNDGVNGLS